MKTLVGVGWGGEGSHRAEGNYAPSGGFLGCFTKADTGGQACQAMGAGEHRNKRW